MQHRHLNFIRGKRSCSCGRGVGPVFVQVDSGKLGARLESARRCYIRGKAKVQLKYIFQFFDNFFQGGKGLQFGFQGIRSTKAG